MSTATQVEYNKAYENSPQEIKNLIKHENSIDILKSIWRNNNIEDFDKQKSLSFEIGCVLVGLTHPKDFVANIVRELQISVEEAQGIAKDVNTLIFSRVKNQLVETYHLGSTNNKERVVENSKNTSPTSFEEKLKETTSKTPDREHSHNIPVQKVGESQKNETSSDSYREPVE